jgi:hypothetical protein
VLPAGRVAITVPDNGVNPPFFPIEKPETVDDPEFAV